MKYLKFSTDYRGVCELVLNRPEIHNAFDEVLIGELTQFFEEANKNQIQALFFQVKEDHFVPVQI